MPIGKSKNTKKGDMRDVTAGDLLKGTGTGRTISAYKELYRRATQKKPGEKGYQPANPNKPMGTKKPEEKAKQSGEARGRARLEAADARARARLAPKPKPKKKKPKKTYHYEYK